jgi:hypothetical protein
VSTLFGSTSAATNSTLDTSVRFLTAPQSITVPAGQTYQVMIVASRAFIHANNNLTTALNVDVGYAATSAATGTGITQSNGTTGATTINAGMQGLSLGPNGANGTPTVPGTIPATANGVLSLTSGGSPTTYFVGMIGNVSATGTWSTGTGTCSIVIVKP